MAERGQSDNGDVLAVGLSIEPVADFGELQRECPECRIFVDYLVSRKSAQIFLLQNLQKYQKKKARVSH